VLGCILAARSGMNYDCWWAEPQSNLLDQPKGLSSPLARVWDWPVTDAREESISMKRCCLWRVPSSAPESGI